MNKTYKYTIASGASQEITFDVGVYKLAITNANGEDGAGNIDKMKDVELTDLQDKQILVYDSASEKWKNENQLSAGSGLVIQNGEITLNEQANDVIAGLSYATSMKKIGGKWIDDNDIFKLTISVGALPNATTATIAHSINGIDKIIKWEAIAMSSTLYTDFVDMVTVDATNVNIDTGSVDMSGYTGYVTVYYTLKKQFAKLGSSVTSFDGLNYWWYRITNNTPYDSWVGMYRYSNSIGLAILSKEQTTGLTVANYTYGAGGNTRGSGDLVCNSNHNNYYYTTVPNITSGTGFLGGNNAGIQVIFNNLTDCLNAFYG